MHQYEKLLTSNTSNLAAMSLANSEIVYRGNRDLTLADQLKLGSEYQQLILYPSEDAIELNAEYLATIDKPIQLIVPDGTWRQAKKIHKRETHLADIICVKVPFVGESIYQLRKQKYTEGLCTFEAIAHALGLIEGEQLKEKLLSFLMIMNERVLITRRGTF